MHLILDGHKNAIVEEELYAVVRKRYTHCIPLASKLGIPSVTVELENHITVPQYRHTIYI